MASSESATEPKCFLEPINFRDEAQCTELLRQRKICGWADTPDYLDVWRTAMDAGTKNMFWIKPASHPDLRVGHVSLDSDSEPADLEVANPHDKSVLTVARLFILPEHRNLKLGRAVMETMERVAREEPYGSKNCRALAITTLSNRYYDEEEYRAEYARANDGRMLPRGAGNENWYLRMGYVKWKDAPLYEVGTPGFEDVKLIAAFMRKSIV
ncbi:hypothetical protein M406DRAFT_358422 [Cryphonectria parasitica EP155]|uniref:N-acetyltransferase domain-containing protein n=1 Tax=Cryphonectria parasitica (strain ATCC 38755 / EP155) TaxID=660469 RepID=A0A9P4XTE2_CRYP1|nr:uncharacterized protein M406DRAFT_358422 [Cryphonectria parasitica EP155]KAF3760974.1 hypothetical protein M406DRAFT_358422 [Cryphonectria parasitica EP155]